VIAAVATATVVAVAMAIVVVAQAVAMAIAAASVVVSDAPWGRIPAALVAVPATPEDQEDPKALVETTTASARRSAAGNTSEIV